MLDSVRALYQQVTKNETYLRYLSAADREEYRNNLACSAAALARLQAVLDGPAKKDLDIFLEEKMLANSAEAEALFTAGLAMGLQLLRLG